LAKKFNISLKESLKEFQFFGINTILKDYQLCFLINDFFDIETHLLNTDAINNELSVFGDIIDDLKVLLIQNNTNIFPKLSTFEYLIVVNNSNTEFASIVKTFESNDEILYISKIEPKYINTKEESLILQLLNIL